MSFSGREFAISAETFNIGLVSRGSSDCIGGIAGADDLSGIYHPDCFAKDSTHDKPRILGCWRRFSPERLYLCV